jgi:hypothetical protein
LSQRAAPGDHSDPYPVHLGRRSPRLTIGDLRSDLRGEPVDDGVARLSRRRRAAATDRLVIVTPGATARTAYVHKRLPRLIDWREHAEGNDPLETAGRRILSGKFQPSGCTWGSQITG